LFTWNQSPKPRGQRYKEACEELGPIFIKIGQLLSTRVDLIPKDIVSYLALLQDKVKPFDGLLSLKLIESELKCDINELFTDFQIQALASASIAQVHAATLKNGTQVVIKVLRPKIYQKVGRDVEFIQILASIMQRWEHYKRFKPKEAANEIAKTIFNELDMLREAANASQLRRNFKNSSQLYIPEVHWEYTTNKILTLERLHGIPITNTQELQNKKINFKKLAETGVEIFFTQVFRDCFFHADMHPGNIWVNPSKVNVPQYYGLDFGIMGSLTPEDQYYLAENFLGFFQRDYRKVALLHIRSGWVPNTTKIDELEAAIRTVCEPIFDKPLKEISFGKTLLRLFQVAKQFNMQIQPQLLLLQKTLISVEGLGRQLYPDLDLWSTAKPYLEQWMRKRISLRRIVKEVKNDIPFWLTHLPRLPNLLYHATQPQLPQQITPKTNWARTYALGLICGAITTYLGFWWFTNLA